MTTLAQKANVERYDITQSPLYMLRSKRKLAELLNCSSWPELNSILRTEEPFKRFNIEKKGKSREVEAPSKHFRPIHNRLFSLLNRLHLPHYLHSGIKSRSYLTNAQAHLGQAEAYTLDIKKFYPSVTRHKVAGFFKNHLKCDPDITAILTDITTCDGHIPTGSPVSMILAFMCCKEMFDSIYFICLENNIRFTCYVDDMTFSGSKITKRWIYQKIKPVVRKHGLVCHKDKHFRVGSAKEITGVIVDGNEIKVPNRKQKDIHDLLLEISTTEDLVVLDELYSSLVGKLAAAGQIEERFRYKRKIFAIKRKLLNLPKPNKQRNKRLQKHIKANRIIAVPLKMLSSTKVSVSSDDSVPF